MKKIYNLSVILLISVISGLFGCDEGKIFSQPEFPPKLETTALEEYTVMASLPQEIKFSINSNTPWTIKSSGPWCQVTPVLSSASSLIAEITVTASKNESTTPRSATITIDGESVDSQAVTIHQDGKGNLEVTKIDETDIFEKTGGEKEFYIVSNKDWSISASATWLTVTPESGTGNGDGKMTMKAIAAENKATKRTATITVRNEFEEFAFNVVQDGILFHLENTDDLLFSGATEVKEFPLTANVEWTAEITEGSDWLTVSPGNGTTPVVIKVSAANNTSLKTRTGKIVVKSAVETLESYILDFTQDTKQDGTTRYDFTLGNQGIYAPPAITFDGQGAHISMPADARDEGWMRIRFEDYSSYKKGIFTWKFSSFNIPSTSSTWFDLNAWESNAGNFHLFMNTNQMNYITTSFGTYNEAYFDNKAFDFTQLETLTVIVDDDPENSGKLKLELFFNAEKVTEIKNLNDLYAADPNQRGPAFYYGLLYEGGDDYSADVTIEYFQQTPIE